MTLYQFPTAFDLPISVSPYSAKLEVYLAITGREYATAQGNLIQAPTRTMPYVRWADGSLQGDSVDIITRLESEGPTLDEGAPEHDLTELVSDANKLLYYACLHSRFSDGWDHQRPTVEALVPWLLRPLAVPFIRRDQLGKCAKAGFSTHEDSQKAVDVIQRMTAQLGDKDFMVDDQPRVADCSLWGHAIAMAHTRVPSASREAVRASPTLMAWIDRMAGRAGWELPLPQ